MLRTIGWFDETYRRALVATEPGPPRITERNTKDGELLSIIGWLDETYRDLVATEHLSACVCLHVCVSVCVRVCGVAMSMSVDRPSKHRKQQASRGMVGSDRYHYHCHYIIVE